MKKQIKNFKKLGPNEYGTEEATFLLNGKKVGCAFNRKTINNSTYKVYEVNGDLNKLTHDEVFEATGKHCPYVLREAIAETLGLDISKLSYQGYVNITDVFSVSGKTYAFTSERGNQSGSRFYMLVEVPEDFHIATGDQIDKRIINQWPLLASTDSPYKSPLKTYKRNLIKNANSSLGRVAITPSNFNRAVTDNLLKTAPETLRKLYPSVKKKLNFYGESDAITKYIDTYIARLNALTGKAKETPAKQSKPAAKKAAPKTTARKPATREKTSKHPNIQTPTPVANVSPEVRFIKRYVLMDGKRKTRKQLLAFFRSLQNEIIKKHIRKTSKYASEIMHIQDELKKILNDPDVGEKFTFRLDDADKKVLEKYRVIASSQKQRTSVRLISRYLSIHGKTAVKEHAERLLKAIKTAFAKKQVTASDPYRAELKKVQSNLETYLKAKDTRLQISKTDLKGLQGIAGTDEKKKITKTQIKRYTKTKKGKGFNPAYKFSADINGMLFETQWDSTLMVTKMGKDYPETTIIGEAEHKEDFINEVYDYLNENEALIPRIKDLGLLKHAHPIKEGSKVFTPFGKRGTVEKVSDGIAYLKEFPGETFKVEFLKLAEDKATKSTNKRKKMQYHGDFLGSITAKQLADIDYETFGFTGKWKSLIGDPAKPFSLMFWSRPGMGKSSLAIELAKYMASTFGQKVLFVAAEEGLSYTLKEKFTRLNALDDNIFIVKDLPADLSPYDVITLDSVTRMKMTSDEFLKLKEKYPDKSYILVFQATVDGGYRGSKEWEHEVDVSIFVNDNGYAKVSKGRFGGDGTLKVFSGTVDHIYKFSQLQDAEKFVANRKDEKLRMVQGDDGKVWVTNNDKAMELKKNGYELY